LKRKVEKRDRKRNEKTMKTQERTTKMQEGKIFSFKLSLFVLEESKTMPKDKMW